MLNIIYFVQQLYKKYTEDNISFLAASIAYFALFSIFPLLLFASSIIGYLSVSPEFERMLINNVLNFFPSFSKNFIADNLNLIVQARAGSGVLSLILALYAGLNAFGAIENSLAIIFSIKASSLIINRAKAFLIVFLTGWLIIVSTIAGLLIGTILNPGILYQVISFLLQVAISFLAFLVVYRFIAGDRMKLNYLLIGSVIAAFAWEILKSIFMFYLKFSQLQSSYGLLTSAIAMLIWIYLSAAIFLLGAELVKIMQAKK